MPSNFSLSIGRMPANYICDQYSELYAHTCQ